MVIKEPVNVNWQTLFAFIPFVSIWAFYRIEKLRKGLVIGLICLGIGMVLQFLLPWPFGIMSELSVNIPVFIHFIRKWSKEWNYNLLHSSPIGNTPVTNIPKNSDDTQFYGCPHCGGNTEIRYEKQYCNRCRMYF
ncbi:MAG: hypothetical protein ACREAD_02040 [Nitrosopumilaceae archaeon]